MIVAVLIILAAALVTVGIAHAQGDQTGSSSTSWFSWTDAISYLAIGAFAGFLHDFNDGQLVNIMPHKTAQGTWDLGIITPALFGGVAGFFAVAVIGLNSPFLSGLFPAITVAGANSGAIAAFFAGYLYSKFWAALVSQIPTQTSTTTATQAQTTAKT